MTEMTQGKHSIHGAPIVGDPETRDFLAWAAAQADRLHAREIRDGADREGKRHGQIPTRR